MERLGKGEFDGCYFLETDVAADGMDARTVDAR